MHYKKEAISYPGIGEVHFGGSLERISTRFEVIQRMVLALFRTALHRSWWLYHVLTLSSDSSFCYHSTLSLHDSNWDAELRDSWNCQGNILHCDDSDGIDGCSTPFFYFDGSRSFRLQSKHKKLLPSRMNDFILTINQRKCNKR